MPEKACHQYSDQYTSRISFVFCQGLGSDGATEEQDSCLLKSLSVETVVDYRVHLFKVDPVAKELT